MTKRHEQKISLRPQFIPLLGELSVDLGDSITFSVKGGRAWVVIPGSAVVLADEAETNLRPCRGSTEKPTPFTAFVVTERTPVRVQVVERAKKDTERVLSYSVLCDPEGEGPPYYAQGSSPPRIKLPPPKL